MRLGRYANDAVTYRARFEEKRVRRINLNLKKRKSLNCVENATNENAFPLSSLICRPSPNPAQFFHLPVQCTQLIRFCVWFRELRRLFRQIPRHSLGSPNRLGTQSGSRQWVTLFVRFGHSRAGRSFRMLCWMLDAGAFTFRKESFSLRSFTFLRAILSVPFLSLSLVNPCKERIIWGYFWKAGEKKSRIQDGVDALSLSLCSFLGIR